MLRSRHTGFALTLSTLFALTCCSVAGAQSGSPGVTGNTGLVVSRASDPAPTVSTAPSLASVLAASWRWNTIALANARGWAWSFAPALAASYSRPVAVRRRAL